MKTCPVCKTQVFDDMDSCYGCMYRFDEPRAEEPPAASAAVPMPVAYGAPAAATALNSSRFDEPPAASVPFASPPAQRFEAPPDLRRNYEPYDSEPTSREVAPMSAHPLVRTVKERGFASAPPPAARPLHASENENPGPAYAQPQGGEGLGWSVRLEVRMPTQPEQVWSAELTPRFEECEPTRRRTRA